MALGAVTSLKGAQNPLCKGRALSSSPLRNVPPNNLGRTTPTMILVHGARIRTRIPMIVVARITRILLHRVKTGTRTAMKIGAIPVGKIRRRGATIGVRIAIKPPLGKERRKPKIGTNLGIHRKQTGRLLDGWRVFNPQKDPPKGRLLMTFLALQVTLLRMKSTRSIMLKPRVAILLKKKRMQLSRLKATAK